MYFKKRIPNDAWKVYLSTIGFLVLTMPVLASGIDTIIAGDTEITITLSSDDYDVTIVELAPYESYCPNKAGSVVGRADALDVVKINRFRDDYDRIYSKFLAVDPKTRRPLGSARYITGFSDAVRRIFPLPRPAEKKGLTCIVDLDDAVKLGVKYINENVSIEKILDLQSEYPNNTFLFEGVQIPINMPYIQKLDAKLKRFTDEGIAVFVVFLNQRPAGLTRSPLFHPNTDIENSPTGILAFHVENEESCRYYRAALEFLADRYTRPDKKYGQISSLIVGNELPQHWVWYNMGLADEDAVLDNYHRAVRLAWLATQKHHSDLRIYISMDHHWASRSDPLKEIQGDVLLDKLNGLSKKHGDFSWHIAFHPYPENLFEPRFWWDTKVTNEVTTPKISFKNIEVLAGFVKQQAMRYQGHARDIALTEQGFHTPDGPDGEKIQAAAYAYSYYKVARISEISAYTLHRQVDHREEGGLKLGLWTADPNAVSPERPLKKKYIWDVFKYADTPQWERYFEFAKPILGIESWGDPPTDEGPHLMSAFTVNEEDILYDVVKQFSTAEHVNNLQVQPREVLRAAGWLVPAVFHHPPNDGVGELIFKMHLPACPDGRKIKLVFESFLGAASADGVGFKVVVNDRELFTGVQRLQSPVPHNLDMTAFSGQEITLKFEVRKNENLDNDWYYWINPLIIYE